MNYKGKFVELLVKSNVLQFGDFTAKSGRKTPYFINTGNYKFGNQLFELGQYYSQVFYDKCLVENPILFGPAYKGIPLIVTTATSLARDFGVNVPICFNRKEKKDHGEGGILVGKIPTEADNIVIIEDVITAGTAIRESMEIIKSLGDVNVSSLIIAVDRMEKGKGELSTLKELERDYGIKTYAIVNIREILEYLHNRSIEGVTYINDDMKIKIENYLNEYGA